MEVDYESIQGSVDTSYLNDPAAAALSRELDRKKQSRSLAIPTNDEAVRVRLRELGEPITLFGEKREDRRDRLRQHVSQLVESGAIRAAESESDSSEVRASFAVPLAR